jgi:hypothetical protein
MRANSKTTLTLAIAAAIVLIGGVAGYAFWTSGGAGSGTAATGSSTDLVVHQTSLVDSMGPGVPAQALSGNFDNDGSSATYVDGLSVVVTGTDHLGCTAADYTITGSPMALGTSVPVGDGQGTWTGAEIEFHSTASNQDACQGATVSLAYEIVATGP